MKRMVKESNNVNIKVGRSSIYIYSKSASSSLSSPWQIIREKDGSGDTGQLDVHSGAGWYYNSNNYPSFYLMSTGNKVDEFNLPNSFKTDDIVKRLCDGANNNLISDWIDKDLYDNAFDFVHAIVGIDDIVKMVKE